MVCLLVGVGVMVNVSSVDFVCLALVDKMIVGRLSGVPWDFRILILFHAVRFSVQWRGSAAGAWATSVAKNLLAMSTVRPIASRVVPRVPSSVGWKRGQLVCWHLPWLDSFRQVFDNSLRCVRRLLLLCMFMLWRR